MIQQPPQQPLQPLQQPQQQQPQKQQPGEPQPLQQLLQLRFSSTSCLAVLTSCFLVAGSFKFFWTILGIWDSHFEQKVKI